MTILEHLKNKSLEDQRDILSKCIRESLASFLMIEDAEEIGKDAHFADLGTSSADAVGFKIKLESELSCSLRTTLLFDYPSVSLLVEYLLKEAITQEPRQTATTQKKNRSLTEAETLQNDNGIAVIAYESIFPGYKDTAAFWCGILRGPVAKHTENPLQRTFAKLPEDIPLHEGEPLGLSALSLQESTLAERWLYTLLGRAMTNFNLDFHYLTSLKVGIYIACSEEGASNGKNERAFTLPLANSISQTLDLKGPSEGFSVFCTSSFMAVQHAQKALLNNDCEIAIVAGLNFISEVHFNAACEKGLYDSLLSPRNTTSSFENGADGFYRSEGAGLILLQMPAKAVACHHEIHAIIEGVAVSHGGKGYSPQAPIATGIKSAVSGALVQAKRDSDAIDYIEAHGIGNVFSDTIELTALDDSYTAHSGSADKQWLVSSVKPLIGHSEVASGMASLIKAILSIKNGMIPGIANFDGLNDEIPSQLRLSVESNATTWKTPLSARAAAIGSYGIGGLNAHMILSGYGNQVATNAPKEVLLLTQPGNFISGTALSERTGFVLDSLLQEIFSISLSEIDYLKSPVHYGFDSIRIVQMIRRLNEKLGIALKLGQLLGVTTFGDFFSNVEAESLKKGLNTGSTTVSTESQNLSFEVSQVQKGLWYIQESYPESTAFNVPIIFQSTAVLEEVHLENALKTVLEMHPVLRSTFTQDPNGTLRHNVSPMALLPKMILQLQTVSDAQEAKTNLWQRLREPFELSNDLLVRFFKIAIKNSPKVYIGFIVHHTIIDGISGVDFTHTFWNTYTALASGKPVDYKAPDHVFFDFTARERSYLASAQALADRDWWRTQLEGISPQNFLPYDTLPHADMRPGAVKSISFVCPQAEYENLKKIASQWNVTLSVLMMTLCKVLLYRITGANDIVLSSPVEGRPEHKDEHAMGCYINMILTRSKFNGATRIHDLAQTIKKSMASALDHSSYPFPQLSTALGIKSEERILNPFPASFTYQNIFDGMAHLGKGAEIIEPVYDIYQETDDHYTFEVYDIRDGLQVNLKYQELLFKQKSIMDHRALLQQLIGAVTADPEQLVRDIQMLPCDRVSELLELSGGASYQLPSTDICRLIGQRALKSPGNIAVVSATDQLTYSQLYQRALSYSRQLVQAGVQANGIVALCMDRSSEVVCSILGILFTGAAYVYIEPDSAPERFRFIVQDTAAQFVLTDKANESAVCSILPPGATAFVLRNCAGDDSGQIAAITGNAPAYVVYTSGSSGFPKGVKISHKALLNQCLSLIEKYSLTEQDNILQFASLSFDMSVEEIFPYLMTGGSVVLRSPEDLLPENFYKTVLSRGITVLNLPPQFYQVLRELPLEKMAAIMRQLRLVAFGGEALPLSIFNDIKHYPIRIFNAYGPSEYTVNAAVAELSGSHEVHIGKPVLNTQLFLLDQDLNLLPRGYTGELYIAGTGLALGYLNLPELNEKAFLACPWTSGKMYKSGDLAQWDQHGNLRYIGRTDTQIKIRGYRIEPGEIEAILKRMNTVDQAIVLAQGHADDLRLTAFYTATKALEPSQLSNFLSQYLPPYMIPYTFVHVSKIPLTSNGKTDFKALESLTAEGPTPPLAAPPVTPTEKVLATILEDLLELKNIDTGAGFYELGGHSLQAIQTILRINQSFNTSLTLSAFFKQKTIKDLAALIENISNTAGNDSLTDFNSSQDEFII